MKKLLFIFFTILFLSVTLNNVLAYKNDLKTQLNRLSWVDDIDLALKLALSENKLILIEFMADWCPPCKRMEKETFSNEKVVKKLNEFILVKINIDNQQEIAQEFNGNAKKYGGIGVPNILFLDKKKNIVHRIIGFHSASELITVMDSVLKQTLYYINE